MPNGQTLHCFNRKLGKLLRNNKFITPTLLSTLRYNYRITLLKSTIKVTFQCFTVLLYNNELIGFNLTIHYGVYKKLN